MEHMRHKNLPGTTEARLLEQTHCHVLALMFAGHETTASTMLFAVKYISENPEVLAVLQAQFLLFVCAKVSMLATWHPCQSIQSAAETTSQDEYEALVCVPKLQVITETIRLCNPIGFSSGYVAPKGWKVICAIREAQHDPANYENPKQFNPWHHGQQNLNPANRLPFFGFGGGARLCPGADLAWLEILVFLHQLVTKFQWELCREDVESYFPLPKLSKGLQINVHKHIKSDPIPSAC
ncbi:unnamed protein product [Sphagnum troendelagicum]